MTLGFLSGSKNFCKLLFVSCEVFVLHGYDWIHWVAKSCTTTAYRWLFRDSHFSLRTLWSVIIKSPIIFCTRYGSANASSARALVIWSFDRSRNFGLWWNEYKHCAYPNPHFSYTWALKIFHEKNWRVSLCVQVEIFLRKLVHLDTDLFISIMFALRCTKFRIVQKAIVDPFKTPLIHLFFKLWARCCSFFSGVFPYLWPWGRPFLIMYSGIERRSNVYFFMKPRLATVSCKRCPQVQ